MMGIPTIKGLPWYFAAEAQNFDLVPGCCPWFGLQEIHDVNLGGSKKNGDFGGESCGYSQIIAGDVAILMMMMMMMMMMMIQLVVEPTDPNEKYYAGQMGSFSF